MGSLDRDGKTVGVYLTICDMPEGDWADGDESLFEALRDQAYSILNRLSFGPWAEKKDNERTADGTPTGNRDRL